MSPISKPNIIELIEIGGISVRLAPEFESETQWQGQELAVRQLRAAWLKMSEFDLPMNPRIIGRPGVGKTTLAVHVAQSLGAQVYLMQSTADTRPEDLIITPVIAENQSIVYVASPLLSAMISGGVCILDEGNRMSEKSWASLAPLLDHRRYVDSVVAGIRIHAHPEFRFVTTMNDDSSVFDLPEYIQSRLSPRISLDSPDLENEIQIIKLAVPYADTDLLKILLNYLHQVQLSDTQISIRDGIQLARYASRLLESDDSRTVAIAFAHAIIAVLGDDALEFIPDSHNPSPFSPPRNGLRPV